MSEPLLDVATLAREPEFHLDRLMVCLEMTDDGSITRRDLDRGNGSRFWECAAGGYFITVDPVFQCGFDEDGDGKVLTIITQRISEISGTLTLGTVHLERFMSTGHAYTETVWECSVTLGHECIPTLHSYDRAGYAGRGRSRHAGTAALLAYLRAWGTLSHNPGQGEC